MRKSGKGRSRYITEKQQEDSRKIAGKQQEENGEEKTEKDGQR